MKEDSELESLDESEEASVEMEEASCCEGDDEESHGDGDSYDDIVEGFASVPCTPRARSGKIARPHPNWSHRLL